MAFYQVKPNTLQKIERAGITQTWLARQAGISIFTLNDTIRNVRRTRGTTAWKIARAYAAAVDIPADQGMIELFEQVGDQWPPPDPAKRESPTARYVFKATSGILFERIGLSQAELARRAEVAISMVNRMVRKGQPARGATAWRIAKVYAAAAQISDDQAIDDLFEVLTTEDL